MSALRRKVCASFDRTAGMSPLEPGVVSSPPFSHSKFVRSCPVLFSGLFSGRSTRHTHRDTPIPHTPLLSARSLPLSRDECLPVLLPTAALAVAMTLLDVGISDVHVDEATLGATV